LGIFNQKYSNQNMREVDDSNYNTGMNGFALPIRVVVYPSEDTPGQLIAHCLELDLVGENKTLEGAVLELFENIALQVVACTENEARLYFPAPQSIAEKYLQAKEKGTKIPDEMIQRIVKRITGNEQIDTIVATKQVKEDCLLAPA